jgi:hypothetical protein
MSRCALPVLAAVIGLISASRLAAIDPERDFSGRWVLDPQSTNALRLPTPPDKLLSVAQQDNRLACLSTEPSVGLAWSFSTDGAENKSQTGGEERNTVAKWEGAALLVNTMVSGPRNYTVMDRWSLSRDRAVLTIVRQVVDAQGSIESVLTYRREGQPAAAPAPTPPPTFVTRQAPPAAPDEIVVPAGTRVLLRLVNNVSTKTAKAGDHVYLETAQPVAGGGRMVIPRGSGVEGTVTAVKRPTRGKGSPELAVRFDQLTLPNGVTRDLRLRPESANADSAQVTGKEGEITGAGGSNTDQKVFTRTMTGATLGTLTGAATGMGAAKVGAIGAAAGIASVLVGRQDVVLPPGTTMELVLGHDLRFKPAELSQ